MTGRERRTIRALTLAFLGAELVAGIQIALPATAHAAPDQTTTSAFVAQLRVDGFGGTNEALVANGKWVCERFTSTEWNYDQMADKFRENNPMTHTYAVQFVSESVLFLCPAYGPRKNQTPGDEQHNGTYV